MPLVPQQLRQVLRRPLLGIRQLVSGLFHAATLQDLTSRLLSEFTSLRQRLGPRMILMLKEFLEVSFTTLTSNV